MPDSPATPRSGRRLAILIPARDEVDRLPRALRDFAIALEGGQWALVTILVADNGSTDGTADVAETVGRELGLPVDARRYPVRGKAAAVCRGLADIAADHGPERHGPHGAERHEPTVDWVLVADADSATDPVVLRTMDPGPNELWVASRHMPGASITRPSGFAPARELMSAAMRLLVRILFRFPLDDTQCGFKLVPIGAAGALGHSVGSRSWVFDVELLARARALGLRLVAFPVDWADVAVSKVKPVTDSIGSLVDLLRIRIRLTRERVG